MTQTFKCPACNAPLKFEAAPVQTCRFCGSDVIVPSDLVKPKEKLPEKLPENPSTEMPVETNPAAAEPLREASELGQKALKIAEIKQALKGNRKVSAAVLFRDSFGGSLADAREIIEAIEKGESINLPDLQADKKASDMRESKKTSAFRWIVLAALGLIAVVLFLIFSGNLFG
jgi:hypothetical protein